MKSFAAFALASAIALPVQSAPSDRQILLRAVPVTQSRSDRPSDAKRARFVEPQLHALDAPPLRRNEAVRSRRLLTAALFDDQIFHIELDRVERNAVDALVWTGFVEGEPESSVSISVKDDVMVATISVRGERYILEPRAGGLHEIRQVDDRRFPPEMEPIRPQMDFVSSAADVSAADAGDVIDILVVYTAALRTSLGSTEAAQLAATNAINATNTAYQNSGVTPRVRLVGTTEVVYDEASAADMNVTLTALRNPSDGQMDSVHALRDSLGADEVALLLLNGNGGCGIAYVMQTTPSAGFASYAFSVTRNNCAVGNLSFPHELGHNFGLEHDRFVSPSGNPAYPFGFGFVDSNSQFRDIMAYSNACTSSCPRIQYFSNPAITYNGRPLGISYESSPSTSADNVRALNSAAAIIANWRQTVVTPYTPAVFTDNPIVAGTTIVKALHINEIRTAINRYRASVGLAASTWSTPTLTAGSTIISATDITEMRSALVAAIPAATFTDAGLAAGHVISAVHVQELRSYLD